MPGMLKWRITEDYFTGSSTTEIRKLYLILMSTGMFQNPDSGYREGLAKSGDAMIKWPQLQPSVIPIQLTCSQQQTMDHRRTNSTSSTKNNLGLSFNCPRTSRFGKRQSLRSLCLNCVSSFKWPSGTMKRWYEETMRHWEKKEREKWVNQVRGITWKFLQKQSGLFRLYERPKQECVLSCKLMKM